ncbi:hypothetical protein PTSG_00977 [Salpingoeca rosetta]|uniref:Uncharacterized protein n=1 Tax=Salpingoeca rosetta (strain ATCC 50818 / BSB-021) TaxID=946362 RepID=F2TY16_SALR5|nr:uncharacterized protein PTSG_00977 [Salpingoeca rosetta]EGD76275.1 hypothetical protein PTSG_00977 [Salpingoeca rosetta]|eukprot:XP_004998450.1 hypothetical protein PTSG_00977 [Salpingoeca rosetta]
MLRSLRGTLNRRKGRRRSDLEKNNTILGNNKAANNNYTNNQELEQANDEELVIQTKECALTGTVSDLGYSGTALAGCGSAWTRSFNMTEATAAKKQREYARPSMCRDGSDNSLDLDETMFLPEEGLPEAAPEDEEVKRDWEDRKRQLDTIGYQRPEEVPAPPQEHVEKAKSLLVEIERAPQQKLKSKMLEQVQQRPQQLLKTQLLQEIQQHGAKE